MDTSPEYILQCEKAEEIQELWKGTTADFYVYKYQKGTKSHIRTNPYRGSHPKQGIWLPRQDQLQEMIIGGDTHYGLIGRLYWWCRNIKQFHDKSTTSMEQLWLAFVMKEKYGKIWDGERWVLPP